MTQEEWERLADLEAEAARMKPEVLDYFIANDENTNSDNA